MAGDVTRLLTVVGVIVLAGYLAGLAFRRWRFPDVLFLIALGALAGPVLGVVDVEAFRAAAPFVATLAIIVILFDGGLEMKARNLRTGVGSGTLLALVVFSLTTVACAVILRLVTPLPWPEATLLAMCFGGAGVVIVVPLIQHLGVRSESVTVVTVEAAVSDVFVVIGVYGLAAAMALQRFEPVEFARALILLFCVGIVVGGGSGWLWARALARFERRSYEYVLTVAVLFLVYAATEFLYGSGPVAILAFGMVLANSRRKPLRRETGFLGARTEESVFGVDLVNFHHETVFFIRTFFFVTLGILVDVSVFATWQFLYVGALLAGAVAFARLVGVVLVYRGDRMPSWDKTAVTLMFPLGLAAAALSVVPHEHFGLAGTADFANYAAVVIVATNALSAGYVWLFSLASFRRRFRSEAVLAEPAPSATP